jgi:hypothetical protein
LADFSDIPFSDKYVSLLKGIDPLKAGLSNLDTEGNEGEILRDIDRTFPRLTCFADGNGHGQRILSNILLACKNFHSNVGYCQGMNCVAAILIMTAYGHAPTPRDYACETSEGSDGGCSSKADGKKCLVKIVSVISNALSDHIYIYIYIYIYIC